MCQKSSSDNIVELIKKMHLNRCNDLSVGDIDSDISFESLYCKIDANEAGQLMDFASSLIPETGDLTGNIAIFLAVFTDYNLDDLLWQMLQRDNIPYAIAFRKAGDGIADKITSLLENDADEETAEKLISSLAWIGSEKVVCFFRQLISDYPEAKSNINTLCHDAGWELRDGQKYQLYYDSCYAVSATDQAGRIDSVSFLQEIDDKCPWCNRSLVNLFQIDPRDSRLAFLPQNHGLLEAISCEVCACYEGVPIFSTKDSDGIWKWVKPNFREDSGNPIFDEQWDRSPWENTPFVLEPRQAIHAASPILPVKFSQIGGLPTWLQFPHYPVCFKCKKTMNFVAQLVHLDFDFYDGADYMFICPDCNVTASLHQIT